MSVTPSLIVSGKEHFAELIHATQLSISLRSNTLVLGADDVLYVFQVSKLQSYHLSQQVQSVDIGGGIRSLFVTTLPRPNSAYAQDIDICLVGTDDGRVLFLHLCGECLLELDPNSGPVKSIFMRTQSDIPELSILCGSAIFILNMEDLRLVLTRSLQALSIPDLPIPTKDQIQENTLFLRFRKLLIPHGEAHEQLVCAASRLPDFFSFIVGRTITQPTQLADASWHTLSVQTLWTVTGRKPFISFNISQEAPTASITSLLYAEAKRVILGSSSAGKRDTFVVRFTDPSGEPVTPTSSCPLADGTPLTLHHGLADQRRRVLHGAMAISSDQQWIAVTDSLGRVLLVDLNKRRVVRMWKGYRDAELAFVDTLERTSDPGIDSVARKPISHPRTTRCLFIHAPHRRILEVWRLTHGPRLATWDVEEPVRLIQVQPQWLGPAAPHSLQTGPQAFMVDVKGVLYTLSVSPELCLAGTDAEAVMGYHEYQIMQECYTCMERIHTDGPGSVFSELIKLLGNFKTCSWFEKSVLHTIHHLSHYPHQLAEFLNDCVELTSSPHSSLVRSHDKLPEVARLRAVFMRLCSMTNFFLKFHALNRECLVQLSGNLEHASPSLAWTDELENIADLLNWDPEDAERCLKLYTFASSILRQKTHLQLSRTMDLHSFIDSFNYHTDSPIDGLHSTDDLTSVSVNVRVHLRSEDSPVRLAKIGSLIFGPYSLGCQSFQLLKQELDTDVLPPELLLYSLTNFLLYWELWRDMPLLIARMHRVYTYLLGRFCHPASVVHRTPSGMTTSGEVTFDSDFKRLIAQIYSYCSDSTHISSAYLISLIIRSLVYTLWQASEEGSDLLLSLWSISRENNEVLMRIKTEPFVNSVESTPATQTNFHSGDSEDLEQRVALGSPEASPPSVHLSQTVLSKMVDQWHDACAQLDDLFSLGLLVQLPATNHLSARKTESLQVSGFPITLGRALKRGRACLTELFASWLVRWQVDADRLAALYHTLCTLPSNAEEDSQPVGAELALVDSGNLTPALFQLVYKHLPFTLELHTVIASISWMYYQLWLNEPEHSRYLYQSIEFLSRLNSAGALISQGLATLMWQGRLRFWYGKCVNALRSTSQLPSKDNELKNISILLMKFMTVYGNACGKAEVVPVFSVEREWNTDSIDVPEDAQLWRDDNRAISAEPFGPDRNPRDQDSTSNLGRTLIAEVAVNQPAPDMRSIASWEQAVIVVSAMNVFGRPLRPKRRQQLRLEPDLHTAQQYYEPENFFVPQDSSPITLSFNPNWISASFGQEVDVALDNRRRFFLSWLTEQAVSSYRTSMNSLASTRLSPCVPSNVGAGDWTSSPLELYKLFTSALVTLARRWGYPKDMALSQHVLALFESNLDDQAELYLSQLQNPANLSTRLLLIVGQRVAWQCFGHSVPTSDQLRWRACIPFELESWLRGLLPEATNMYSEEAFCDPSLSPADSITHLAHLIDLVLQHLPAHASQAPMAEALRDAIYAMID
ncbi:Rab3 GTPase-activating protein non-catalytic subunit [Clonorchis sinensis]|uniref:Rab3 GTPase-activating protein non-catalytic subunit n=1 Tax=Clonorchis sinensis TaxID=79923 RepID=A0A8T1MKN0_CLOSI|nr:Rab3 GTPase-activating protein non-catalytic subunit [Clonorchis sinensis]